MKKLAFVFASAILFSACTQTTSVKSPSNYQLTDITVTPTNMISPTVSDPQSQNLTAVIKTNKGTMKVVLFSDIAPNTVRNFVELAKGTKINPNTGKKVSDKPFYNGVIFHRIIKGFMIQGGDPTGTGSGGPGYKFADEPVTESYTRGTIAMANSGPNTNGSQFFITHKDNALPPNYTIFGRIEASDSASLKTLDEIASVSVGMSDMGEMSVPQEKVFIESVTIEEE